MRLKEYFGKHRIHPERFAVDNGISITTLYRYLKEVQRPHLQMAVKIEKATNGEVTVEELRGIHGK